MATISFYMAPNQLYRLIPSNYDHNFEGKYKLEVTSNFDIILSNTQSEFFSKSPGNIKFYLLPAEFGLIPHPERRTCKMANIEVK